MAVRRGGISSQQGEARSAAEDQVCVDGRHAWHTLNGGRHTGATANGAVLVMCGRDM
jgi:hypothetical protein